VVLDGLLGLYGLKYDSATASGLPLYLCSYKLVGSAIGWSEPDDCQTPKIPIFWNVTRKH